MMNVSRRDLFRLLAATASGSALFRATERVAGALAASADPPVLVWLHAGAEDMALLTLLGQDLPRFQELVSVQWDVREHGGLEPTGYSPPALAEETAPILVAEAMPPPGALAMDEGSPLTQSLARAKAAILLGTEACYGGFTTNPALIARFEQLCRRAHTPLLKLPGVPPPPHHLVGVLAHLEFFGFPRLDAHARPLLYYGRTVCETCERRDDLDAGRFARRFGETGCLLRLGCKGLITHNTCSTVRWNNGENWCVGAGGPCTGCSEPGYPDHDGVGLYGALSGGLIPPASGIWGTLERVGYGLLGVAGAGIALQTLRRLAFPPREGGESPPPPDGER